MKTKNGFTLLEKTSEIGAWLNQQTVTRKITTLQVHHMGLPSYSTWENTDKKIFSEPHFGRTESLDTYGKKTWNSKSANGKYIAQHFNVFPDGMITTGRSLNSTPIGISGWNTNAICVEIYGNFDKGQDTMTSEQKEAVIALFGELCKRFNITPSSSTIRYHGWFTSGGTYLGNYIAGKSRKTCPGTNFFGGNTMTAYNANFLPAIKNYIANGTTTIEPTTFKQYIVKTTDELNGRQEASASSKIMLVVTKGTAVTIVAEEMNGTTKWLKTKSGYYISANYTEFVRYVEDTTTTTTEPTTFKQYIVKTTDELNGRQEASASSKIMLVVTKGTAVTIVAEEMNGTTKWLKTKSGYYISANYTEFVRYV